MRIALLLAACVLASCRPAFAQDTPSFDVAGGYAFLRDQSIEENFQGWVASTTAHLTRWLGVTAEVGGHYNGPQIFGTDLSLSVHSLVAGPRVSLRPSSRVTPFAHVLLGAARAAGSLLEEMDSVTEFALQPGGGVDVWISSTVGVRVGGDLRRVFTDEASTQFRFVAGVVVSAAQR